MEIRAIFFDLYGTLFLYQDMDLAWQGYVDALHECTAAAGADLSREALSAAAKTMLEVPAPEPADYGFTVYERRLHAMLTGLGFAAETQLVREAAHASVSAWQRALPLDPHARDVLTALQTRVPLALVTNFDFFPHIHRAVDEQDLRSYFQRVVVSSEVGFKKPDPRIFDPALEAVKVDPARAAYVGDSVEDVEGAKAAGMTAIRIVRPNAPPRAGVPRVAPDHTIADLRELLDLVNHQ